MFLVSAMFLQILFATQGTMAYPHNSAYSDALVTTGTDSAPFDYIVSIVMENHGICAIVPNIDCSSPSNIPAPYMSSLALAGGLATNYTTITHPSLPNYLALFTGQDWGCTVDATKVQRLH